VGEDHRGHLLELLLSKLRIKQVEMQMAEMQAGGGSGSPSDGSAGGLQIIGMSASIPNAQQVCIYPLPPPYPFPPPQL
jgi:DNA polymerase theta